MGDVDQSSQSQMSDSEMESLLNPQAQGEIPMGDEPTPPSPTPAQAPAQAPAQEIEFTANGKPIKVPYTDPRIKQWASQGYDYAQRMALINQEREAFLNEKKVYDERFKPIDDYVKENPSWWDHVQKQWEQRETFQADPNNPFTKEISSLRNELKELKQFKQEFVTQKQAEQQAREDAELDQEIKSMRGEYPDIDFNAHDQNGKTLEARVIDHGIKNGFKTFKSAFRDFYHDELLKRAEERGKESIVKDQQKKTKLGLLGKTQAPTKSVQNAQDHRGKTYDDLKREALDELGIA